MTRTEWIKHIQQGNEGCILVSKEGLKKILGIGNDKVNKLTAGLERYGSKRGKGKSYAIPDVAEKLMEERRNN